MNEEQAFKVLEAVNNAYDSLDKHDALAKERLELAHNHLKLMQNQITVLHEIIDEKNEEIRLLLAQVKDWKSQFDIALNERNEVMVENSSARSVHEALVRNLTNMCNTAAKAFAERDAALAEVKRLTPIADAQYSSYTLAGLYMAERDRARRLVCELQCDPPERFVGLPHEVAQMYEWKCFGEQEDHSER